MSLDGEEMLTIADGDVYKSATIGRKPLIKISQTKTLVLVSIKEPNLREEEVNVLIEPQNISVEFVRVGIENPVFAGTLFEEVQRQHCRVRIKDDCALIKLRKQVPGLWSSILSEVSTDLKRSTATKRLRPVKGSKTRGQEKDKDSLIARSDPPAEMRDNANASDLAQEIELENSGIKAIFDGMKSYFSFEQKCDIEVIDEQKDMATCIMPSESGFDVEVAEKLDPPDEIAAIE